MNTQSTIKKTIGILGGKGMLGTDLCASLSDKYNVTAIDLDTYTDYIGNTFDYIINANGNSKRFWANAHVYEDFEASTISVYKSIINFKCSKYIYISSSDVYPDHSSIATTKESDIIDSSLLCPYGFHKFLSEKIVQNNCKDYLIIRPCLLLGTTLRKGPVFDIINNNPLFITEDSRIAMITTSEIANVIDLLIQQNRTREIYNVGGTGTVNFNNVEDIFGKKPEISTEAQQQLYELNTAKVQAIKKLKSSTEYLNDILNVINFKKA